MDAQILERLEAYFTAVVDVQAVYIFGSVAKGREHAGSDLDLAVLLAEGARFAAPVAPLTAPSDPAEETLARFEANQRIARAVEELVKRPVDVIDLARSPLILQSQVLKYGFLLYEGDRKARIAYEVDFRRKYFDFKPLWEEHARRRIERLTGQGEK